MAYMNPEQTRRFIQEALNEQGVYTDSEYLKAMLESAQLIDSREEVYAREDLKQNISDLEDEVSSLEYQLLSSRQENSRLRETQEKIAKVLANTIVLQLIALKFQASNLKLVLEDYLQFDEYEFIEQEELDIPSLAQEINKGITLVNDSITIYDDYLNKYYSKRLDQSYYLIFSTEAKSPYSKLLHQVTVLLSKIELLIQDYQTPDF